MTDNYGYRPRAALEDQWARTPQGVLMTLPYIGPVTLGTIQMGMLVSVAISIILCIISFFASAPLLLILAFIFMGSGQSMYWPVWIGTSHYVSKAKEEFYGF